MDAVVPAVVFGFALAVASGAAAQETVRVSVDASGAQADLFSSHPAISADGRFVTFCSNATNLIAGDKNGMVDIFVYDRLTGVPERASLDSSGGEADAGSFSAAISADGTTVGFDSWATNLVSGDTNGLSDVFIHDRASGLTERVDVDSAGAESDGHSFAAALSADGRIVAYCSYATNLVAGDTNGESDVFVRDRAAGITERVSVDSNGAEGNGDSQYPSISGDGRFVAFHSKATNLVPGDTKGKQDIFVRDRTTGITERLSVDASGVQGNGDSEFPSISEDGRWVAFASISSNLVSGDVNNRRDVFVHDRSSGSVELVSVSTAGKEGNDNSGGASISADGRTVAFASWATNLVTGDKNATFDAFVHDRPTRITERLSVDSAGVEGNAQSSGAHPATQGGVVAFDSFATNLVSGDTNSSADIFVRELCDADASWSNYGAGFPGTNGVPSFTAQSDPVLGAALTVDVGNSAGAPTSGLLFVGFSRASLHTAWGSDLLVVPALTVPITFSYGADSFTGVLPDDWTLCSLAVDLQVLELDPGAAKGVSFTPGLELLLGR